MVHAAGDGSLSLTATVTDFPAAVLVSCKNQIGCSSHQALKMARAGKGFWTGRRSELHPNHSRLQSPDLLGTDRFRKCFVLPCLETSQKFSERENQISKPDPGSAFVDHHR